MCLIICLQAGGTVTPHPHLHKALTLTYTHAQGMRAIMDRRRCYKHALGDEEVYKVFWVSLFESYLLLSSFGMPLSSLILICTFDLIVIDHRYK